MDKYLSETQQIDLAAMREAVENAVNVELSRQNLKLKTSYNVLKKSKTSLKFMTFLQKLN